MSGGKNKMFLKDPVKFMQTYAVVPGDNIGYEGDNAIRMKNALGTTDYFFSTIAPTHQVAWLNFSKFASGQGSNTFLHKAPGAVAIDGSYLPLPHKVKSYFLPWSAAGAIINLKIPKKNAIPVGQDDADFFFTASITGCSIFIKGTPDNPTIYHAGGDTGQSDPAAGAAFWRNLMFTYSDARAISTEVNKTDYVSDPLANLAGKTTRNAEIFETWLKNNSSKSLDISMTQPYGCVMGIRDPAGNWTFYLQENATIFYFKMKKESLFSKTRVQDGGMRLTGRPMIFREIFPNGTGHQTFVPQLPRKI